MRNCVRTLLNDPSPKIKGKKFTLTNWQKGFLIHLLGDTYAHSKKLADGSEKSYPPRRGHAIDSGKQLYFNKKTEPDYIENNVKRYLSYVDDLGGVIGSSSLAGKNNNGFNLSALKKELNGIFPESNNENVKNKFRELAEKYGLKQQLGNGGYDPLKDYSVDKRFKTPSRSDVAFFIIKLLPYCTKCDKALDKASDKKK